MLAKKKSDGKPLKFLTVGQKHTTRPKKGWGGLTLIECRMANTVTREFIECHIELRENTILHEVFARMEVALPEPKIPENIKTALDTIQQYNGRVYVEVYTGWKRDENGKLGSSGFTTDGFAIVEYGQLQLGRRKRLIPFDEINRLKVSKLVLICDSEELEETCQ